MKNVKIIKRVKHKKKNRKQMNIILIKNIYECDNTIKAYEPYNHHYK